LAAAIKLFVGRNSHGFCLMAAFCAIAEVESRKQKPKENIMLWTITVILLVLWLLGMVTSYTLGGMLHILLVVAVIMAIVSLVSGRRTVV
jgi:hypothetical protein